MHVATFFALKFGLLLSLIKLTFIYFYITALQCRPIMVLYYASLERKQVLMCSWQVSLLDWYLYVITSVTFL